MSARRRASAVLGDVVLGLVAPFQVWQERQEGKWIIATDNKGTMTHAATALGALWQGHLSQIGAMAIHDDPSPAMVVTIRGWHTANSLSPCLISHHACAGRSFSVKKALELVDPSVSWDFTCPVAAVLTVPVCYTAAGPSFCDALIRRAVVQALSTAVACANGSPCCTHRVEIESGELLHAELTM